MKQYLYNHVLMGDQKYNALMATYIMVKVTVILFGL
jgi:hypothetical protein